VRRDRSVPPAQEFSGVILQPLSQRKSPEAEHPPPERMSGGGLENQPAATRAGLPELHARDGGSLRQWPIIFSTKL
jgi:hypothetical protein